MASSGMMVVNGEKDDEGQKRKYMKRAASMNQATSPSGGSKHCVCVCAPTTHAGSFKCRLHRLESIIWSALRKKSGEEEDLLSLKLALKLLQPRL